MNILKLLNKGILLYLTVILSIICQSCGNKTDQGAEIKEDLLNSHSAKIVKKYIDVELTTDLTKLSEEDKKILPLLIEAAKLMDEVFWMQSYPLKDSLYATLKTENEKKAFMINYGPYDRLGNLQAFIEGVPPKPKGANFYPADITEEEYKACQLPMKDSQYHVLLRNDKGELATKPYHEVYQKQHKKASELLAKASELATESGLKNYLSLRSKALLDDNYNASDRAWLDMKDNSLDIIIGPIENYEDQLLGIRTAHEAYVLVKDKEWSEKLKKFANFLPELQRNLPVPDQYKKETPGTDSDLGAYDVIYYAGDCNAGSKTIAVNLPNDEKIQLEKGTRRLQLKNAMRAKYDKILLPIADELLVKEQRKHITFDAFFANTMFHEVAHGLGIKYTINGKGAAKDALKQHYSAIEEGKADILGIYMVKQLFDKGEIKNGSMEDYYVTFVTSIFRSVRFGASSAHGKANMLRFNYFLDKEAIIWDENEKAYRVNFDKIEGAIASLSERILKLQGDGDYLGTEKWILEEGVIKQDLQKRIDALNAKEIPVDVVFRQGLEVLGL